MAANYSLSSAPGQACAWRIRPHFRRGLRRSTRRWRRRRRLGGRGRAKNVNLPPMKKSQFTGPAPLLLSNQMVLSGDAKLLQNVCIYGRVCENQERMDKSEEGDTP